MTSHTLFAKKTKTVQEEDSFLTTTDCILLSSSVPEIIVQCNQMLVISLADGNVWLPMNKQVHFEVDKMAQLFRSTLCDRSDMSSN